jgi:putative DNA primase/helicase
MGGGFKMTELDTIKQAAKVFTEKQRNQGYQSVGLYQYTDTEGVVLYARLRMDHANGDKWIRPLSRDEAGNWTQLKEPSYPEGKPLYHLHLIASNPDKSVYLVEGEKCADALTKLGLIATTSGGATSANDANWKPLSNREVLIWADNDVAGLQYEADALAKLTSVNATVTQINIDQLNLAVKGDCIDWLQQFEQSNGRSATSADIQSLPLKTDPHNQAVSDCLMGGDANVLPQTDDDVVAWLATLKPIDYDRARKEKSKLLGVRPAVLDNMVKAEREANIQDDSPFTDIEPWHEAIDPAQLLDDITSTIQRFIVLDKHQAQTAALWVSACWFIDVINCAPIALINAPEKQCGKSQLLTLLGKLAPRTAQASGISPSVLFRMIEKYQPTLFIDEVETVLKDNEELRGLINAGHTRDSAYVWRSVAKADDFEPKRFSVWSMKAIAGINAIKLASTVTDRSIVFELRRKTANEKVERIRHAEAGLFDSLASKLARFSDDYTDQVRQSRPNLPDALGDREQDNWEPLLQVASVAGGHWLDTALSAALKLSDATQTPISSANELLADIQEVFEAKGANRITTTELINTLCEDTEKSWATYNRGKQLSPRQLSNKLKDYGITSKTIRMSGYATAKGYEREQFDDAFARYLADPLNLPSQSHNLPEASKDGLSSVTDRKVVTVTEPQTVTLEPPPILGCDGVTDKTPVLRGATAARAEYEAVRY